MLERKTIKRKLKINQRICIIIFSAMLSCALSKGASANSLKEPYIDADTGLKTYNVVYYGYYPQDEVKADELTEEIKSADYSSGSAVVNGCRYKKIIKKNVSSEQTVGYYRYEPIAWRILKNDGTTLTLQSTHALDSVKYSLENDAVSYDDSYLRTWLNNEFKEDAFTDDRGLKECSVGKTGDKVTVFNNNEVVSSIYHLDNATNRVMSASEYALANGVYTYGQLENYAVSYWTTECNGSNANYINNQGTIGTREQNYDRNAAVPIIQLAIDEYYYSIGNPETKQPEYSAAKDNSAWDIIEFGYYPQKEIKGNELTAAIKNATYVQGISTIGDSQYMRLYINNEYRYFIFQPIRWKVLNREDGEIKLQSSVALDIYNGTSNNNTASWESSALYEWLNDEFLSIAFTTKQQQIVINKRIDMLSDREMHDESYGYVTENTRLLYATDYAKAKGKLTLGGYTSYWLRSEESNHYLDGYINEKGSFIYSIFSGNKGVVPTITIKEYPCLWSVNGYIESGEITSGSNSDSGSQKGDSELSAGNGNSQNNISKYFTQSSPKLNITNISSKKQKLSWRKVSGAKGYIVYRSTKKNKGYKKIASTTKNKATSTKLKIGRTYYYYVCAYKTAKGVKQYSYRSNKVKKKAGYPKKPGIYVRVKKKDGKKIVIINWNKVTDGKYVQLYRKKTKGKYQKLLDKKITKSYKKGVTISYRLSSGKYTFKIRTYNKSAKKKYYSKMSKVVSVKL